MIRTRTLSACAVALTFALAAGAAEAQKPPAQTRPSDQADQLLSQAVPTTPAPVNDGEAYRRADDADQDPVELRTTQALNDEIASRNQLAENQERADQAAFEAERAKHEEAVTAATRARLAYEEDVRRSEAAQRQWEADRARWEADVRACQAGDRSRCAPPRY
ncbi:cell wall hydrolase [Brevundimonas sp.]|uniref:cell wall hydrolase n=1 Tax=Brevundimonas sp. TaxID=1871086 RepID=UPI00286B8E2B|nr:cell wall hydrolase [Brevundimonas sp.]